MKKFLNRCFQGAKTTGLVHWLSLALFLFLALLAACSPKIETVTVEVTRVVTETVTNEGQAVEVTRVVTETIIETVEINPEEEPDEEPPLATGSEGDAEPLPPPPAEGPKIPADRGSSTTSALVIDTAVTLRANQTNSVIAQETAVATSISFNSAELKEQCRLVARLYKKQCS